MNNQSQNLLKLTREVLHAFRSHLWLWIIPTAVMASAATGYAIVRPVLWEASQALVVRDEAGGSVSRQGRFDSIDNMKAFQETVQEVARSPIVVEGALKHLGPPPTIRDTAKWPTERDIEDFQAEIRISAPKGSEFGRTEVIYLSVTGNTREAAVQRTTAVCDQLEKHLGQLRNLRAASVISEVEESLNLAQKDLDFANETLATMEREVGGDLSELRVLNQSSSGEGNLRVAQNQVKAELRQAQSKYESQQQQRELLVRAQANPEEILGTPSQLLESQPALRRLKEGLVEAQLRTAQLRGKMSPDHPMVLAAIRAEEDIRRSLQTELDAAVHGLDADIEVAQRQLQSLERQHQDFQTRLDRLAGLRARYALLVEDVKQRSDIVENAKKELADARSGQTAAQSASLITRFQSPQVGDSPVGPGRVTIVAAGLGGGLLTGIGFVLLVAPIGQNTGRRRWSDYLPFGRRAADRGATQAPAVTAGAGRRANEQPPASAAVHTASNEGALGRRADDRADQQDMERRQAKRRAEDRK